MPIRLEVLSTFKPIDEGFVDQLLAQEIANSNQKIVVLDDDPTGVQTVHDISVYTDWSAESMDEAFAEEENCFFILTNSRGLTEEETTKIHLEISQAVDRAAKNANKEYIFISRSDSTLRGHFPLETELLKTEYEKNTTKKVAGEILCPFFKEGGRFTIGDIHYVKYEDELIPINETEFAKDKTFGFKALTLPEYVEEKTKGAYPASNVVCISNEDIHNMDFQKIESQLMDIEDFNKIIVNAVDYADLKVFCIALYRVMAKGKMFMMRTAAGIIKVMCGIKDCSLLTKEDMIMSETTNGGVIVVGSHTAKTTQQLDELRKIEKIDFVELNASLVKDTEAFLKEIERCLIKEKQSIASGRTVCCYTSRALVTADTGDKEDELRLSVKISDAVQTLVKELQIVPAFVIAKGGITSSDVGVKALSVRKAKVLGQVEPGIPVWQTGNSSKWPGIPYIIFPGNVGEKDTLVKVVKKLIT